MYERIIEAAIMTPWAISERYLAVIAGILAARRHGIRWTAEEIQARIGAAPTRPDPVEPNGTVAVVPIHGVIAHRVFEASSGMISADEIAAMLRRAIAMPEVGTILFDVASPGGTVTGMPELAEEIRAARKKKYLVATSNGEMGSAAYWLASQAHEIVAIPSSSTGSIGVWMLHLDESELLAKEGIKATPISAGKYKVEMAPWAPLSDDAKVFLQAQVDGFYQAFLASVAKGRGVSVTAVRTGYGEGRALGADEALEAGLIDAIETVPQTMARLTAGKRLKLELARAEDLDLPEVVCAPPERSHLEDVDAGLRIAERC